jgi:hypothetical protein
MTYYSDDDYIKLKEKNQELQMILQNTIRQAEKDKNSYEDVFTKLQLKIESLIDVNCQLRSLSELKERENDDLARENYHLSIKVDNLIQDLESYKKVINVAERKEKEFLLLIDKYERKYGFIKEKYLNLKFQNIEKEKIINVIII